MHPHPDRRRQKSRASAAAAAVLALLLAGFMGTGCRHRPPSAAAAHDAWRATRALSIGGTNGWAALAGLHWLAEGTHSVGSGPANAVRLPPGSAPERVGTLTRTGSAVRFEAAPGVDVRLRGVPVTAADLKSDAQGKADELAVGRVQFWLLERGERRAIRVRDPESPERRAFRGIPTAPFAPRWAIRARLEPASPPRRVRIDDVTGGSTTEEVAGTLVFAIDGRQHRLEALLDREAGDLWVLFGDATSGRTTYGSGRFLHAPMPDRDGWTTLDFNRAYNPPCAFTRFATCPLPPRPNWLPVAVPVGELAPAGHP